MNLFKKETGYKTSWYDGWFCAMCSDRSAEKALQLNKRTREFVADSTNVLDIGCGVGSLDALLSDKCSSVTGVDISPRMIKYAKKHNSHASNVAFLLIKKNEKLSDIFNQKFDFSILKMVLHEMPEEERTDLLNEARKVSGEIIIIEWLGPQPKNLSGKGTFMNEMMSTVEHFRNFRQWHATGGLDGFLERHGLRVVQEEMFINKTGKIVRVNWQ